MQRPRLIRSLPLVVSLAVCLVTPLDTCARICVDGPFPDNEGNRLTLCSPEATELSAEITTDGLRLSWDAPPSEQTTHIGPLMAIEWGTVAPGDAPPGVTLSGTYQAIQDRRIEIAVTKIGAAADTAGFLGDDVVTVRWLSTFETSSGGEIVGGEFELDATTLDRDLQFVIDNEVSEDTSKVGGVRIRFDTGTFVRNDFRAAFDVQDFDGYTVWRWLSEPFGEPAAWGNYNKRINDADPPSAWPDVQRTGQRFTFVDENVFDGLVYHYAVTSYDQGFSSSTGNIIGINFNSPLPEATIAADGSRVLGATQVRVDFRLKPPTTFKPVFAVPNPFRQTDCDPGDFEGTCTVRFINLPRLSRLQIYTLAGDLVDEIAHDNPNEGTLIWDTLNGQGEEVASGVYIFKIIDLVSGQESFGRLVVIR